MTSRSPGVSLVTPRERDVLSLVARHLTNNQIADELCVSVRTVEAHMSSLMRKLQVSDRRSLARRADATGAPDRARWPAPITTFVGRAAERGALLAAVGAHRMVTVTGPAGVGKTRLALHVAQELASTRRDGGWFVDLVQVTDPAMVIAAVASTVGVAERHGSSIDDAVMSVLTASDAVIVLDNCEHLIGAVRSCAERLLVSCPSLAVIATSRSRLAAPFEWVYPLAGLSVTDDGGDAVTLFVERATAAGADHTLDRHRLAELCRALDGMALAIELAAARYPSFGLDGLLAGLDRRLRVLTSGAGPADRHQSLRDAIAWSYRLLGGRDRDLLCRMSVFASWFDVDAASSVAGTGTGLVRADVADGLARLADHNLLVVAPGDPTHYRALESIRQYGEERLTDDGACDTAHDRHREWCRDQLATLAEQDQDGAWCERVDRVATEVRAAIVWADAHQRDSAVCDLAERLAHQLLLRGQPAEAQRRHEQAAQHAPAGAPRARLLRLAAGAAACRVVGNDTLRLLNEAATEALAASDHAAAAEDRAWMVIYLGQAPGIIADLPSRQQGQRWLAEARQHASAEPRALAAIAAASASALPDTEPDTIALATDAAVRARAAGVPLVESVALDRLCACHLGRGELTAAVAALRRRGDVLDALSLDASTAFQFNDYLLMASEVHLAAGDLRLAARYADALAELACYREQEHLATSRRIKVDAITGDLEDARQRGEHFLAAWERAGRPIARTLGATTYAVAMVHGLLGDEGRRREWIEITVALASDEHQLEGCVSGWAPTFDALVAMHRDRPDLALARLSADIDDPIWSVWAAGLWRPWYAALWAEAAVLAGHPDAEARLRRSVAATAENPVASAVLRRAVDLARGKRGALEDHARTFAQLGCRYQQRRTLTLLGTA